jgi:hypothetical protein
VEKRAAVVRRENFIVVVDVLLKIWYVQYRLRCVWLLTLKGKKFFFVVMSAIITDDFFHIRLDDVRVCVGISVTSDLSFSSFLFLLFMFEFRGFQFPRFSI